jgi:CRISPR-associated endoribonuclease Cas6
MAPISLQRSKFTGLYTVVVELGAADQGKICTTTNTTAVKEIYTQVMNCLSLVDAQTANLLQNSQISPFSISGLMGYHKGHAYQPGDNLYFRISLLDANLLNPLLQGIEIWGSKPVFFAQKQFITRNIYTLPGTHSATIASSYESLATISQSLDDITFKLLSPTSFKQANSIQPFPLPDLVFGNLLRRWNTFAPQQLKFNHNLQWQGLVSAYDLKTHTHNLETRTEIGAQGWIRYKFSDEQKHITTTLAYFAEFAGIGRKTTMGMGQTVFIRS